MSTNRVSSSRTIRATRSTALAVLHDPPKLAHLSPLVVSCVQSPDDPHLYSITDTMTMFGMTMTSWVYTARFTELQDGTDVQVQASAGVRLKNQWRAKAVDDSTCEVTETVTVEAGVLVRPLVIFMLKKSHKQLLDALVKQLEGDITRRITISSNACIPQALAFIAVVLAVWSPVFNASKLLKQMASAIISFLALGFVLRPSDPYGSFHIAFNVPPGDDPKRWPNTEWLNMGYWKDTQIFPRACEALALRMIRAGRCMPGGHVLDVGHACGDSLLLHLCHPDVPRPASLTGMTSLPSQHKRSLERLAKEKPSVQVSRPEVTLYCGDAIFRSKNIDHPLNPSSPSHQFTTILALDCAYHFAPRETFLCQSFARLSPGGSIALADLVVAESLPYGLRTFLSTALSVRPENMITPQIYEVQLRTIGYTNVRIEDISVDVFPGFRRFLRSRGRLWRLFELILGWWVNAGGRFVIVSASKPKSLPVSDLS